MLANYTTKKHEQYGDVLLINGNESICPFKPAIAVPVQNKFGEGVTMQIVTFPCCTSCPHAQLEQLGINDTVNFNISCTASIKDLDIVY